MFADFFVYWDTINNHLWMWVAFPVIILFGALLTFRSGFTQFLRFPLVVKTFLGFMASKKEKTGSAAGVHPISAFFACIGGCIGIGNIVGICVAAQIGGPGALLWVWIAAFVAMIVKYSEVYLGVKFRVPDGKGGHKGGPMYFLQKAFKGGWAPMSVCLLLCLYGVEVYQFSVMTHSITDNFDVNPLYVVLVLLGLVLFAGKGGVKRIGSISSAIIPLFLVIYLGMGAWVLYQHIGEIPGVLATVFASAFTGHAAVGGFAGSSLILTISMGLQRGCYSTDVGVGYASIIHSETSARSPEKQASLAIFDVFVDTFLICTMSVLLILVTGVWKEPIPELLLVQTALGQHFPYMHIFMPFFLFLLGYSTIIAFFCAGLKSAEYLGGEFGRKFYYVFAAVSLFVFSFVDTYQAMIVMATIQALLLFLNFWGMFRLRGEIDFDFS